jgi:hypothetical protein
MKLIKFSLVKRVYRTRSICNLIKHKDESAFLPQEAHHLTDCARHPALHQRLPSRIYKHDQLAEHFLIFSCSVRDVFFRHVPNALRGR